MTIHSLVINKLLIKIHLKCRRSKQAQGTAELMCRLFDDNGLEDFVEYRAIQVVLSISTISELKKLIDLLNNYHEKESDDQIINDPDWEKICDQAKIVVSDWVKHE